MLLGSGTADCDVAEPVLPVDAVAVVPTWVVPAGVVLPDIVVVAIV